MDRQTEEKDIIKIKRTRGYIPLFLMLSVVLLALSIYCVIYAYTNDLDSTSSAIFYVAGAIGILFFTYSAFDNLFQTIQPKNALIIGDEGFADFTVGGVGVGMIKWDNIKSLKTVRSKDGRLLMVELKDFNAVVDDAPKSVQNVIMKADWEDNSIAIRQIDVAERLAAIIDIFNKHINAAEQTASEEDNCKTKVMSDADVKSLFHALSEQKETAPEKQTAASRRAEPDVKIADDLSETVAVPEIPSVKKEVKTETEVSDVDEKLEQMAKEVEKEKIAESDNGEVKNASDSQISDIDSIIDSIKSDSKAKNGSDINSLMAKFGEEIKSGKSRLNDSERTELADELTALLEDIKKKKNNK